MLGKKEMMQFFWELHTFQLYFHVETQWTCWDAEIVNAGIEGFSQQNIIALVAESSVLSVVSLLWLFVRRRRFLSLSHSVKRPLIGSRRRCFFP